MLPLYTVTAVILLTLGHQASGMAVPQIPQIYDHGGLFAENACQLKSIPDVTCYLEWAANQGWIKRTCPPGTKFVAEACQCLTVPQIDGGVQDKSNQIEPALAEERPSPKETLITPSDCLLKPAADPASFMELVEGHGFVTRTCSEGTVFNAQECACTIISETDNGHDKDNSNLETNLIETATKEEPAAEVAKKKVPDSQSPCTKKPVERDGFFKELVQGHGWMTRPCPEGTIFKTAVCECLKAVDAAAKTEEGPQTEKSNQNIESQETTLSYSSQPKGITDGHLKEKVVGQTCSKVADPDPRFYLEFTDRKTSVRVACAEGTTFNAQQCQCVEDSVTTPSLIVPEDEPESPGETVDKKPTSKPCTMKADTVSNRYLELIEGHGWMSRPCPEGTTFNAKTCQCSSAKPETDTNSVNPTVPEKKNEPTITTITTAQCTRKPSVNEAFYFQMVSGGSWILMRCAEGTAYNAQTCGCTSSTDGKEASNDSSENHKEPAIVSHPLQHETDLDNEIVCNKKPADHITRYQELVEGFGWIIRDCASGTGFDPDTCTCSIDYLVKHLNREEKPCNSVITFQKKIMSALRNGGPAPRNAFCFRKPSVNPQFYFEMVEGMRWVIRVCPQGTIFVPQMCRCFLPFSKDIREKEVVDGDDASLDEKMLAQKIFNQLNTAPQPHLSFYPYHPTLGTRPPTQSKYETMRDPNFRIN